MSLRSRFARWSSSSIAPPSGIALWLGGALLLWVLYAFVFTQTSAVPLGRALADAAANVLPLVALSAATHLLVRGQVMSRPVLVQALAHTGLAIGFATTWYALVLVALAFCNGLAGEGFHVSEFSGPAFTWQVFQGLVLYAVVAATTYALRGGKAAASVALVAPPPLQRYLTRSGDEMVPINVGDIVSITGAQDYAEVATLSGRHLVRMSLGEFERRLDPVRFLRVHRSTIVNFDHLASAEPAGGGRMLAHMANGDRIPISRAGVQVLRTFVV